MPYICSMRPDYNGVLQIKDLVPNKSQYNPTLGSNAKKPTYINSVDYTEIPEITLGGTDGRVGTTRPMSGLAAFIFMESVTADAGLIRLEEANSAAFWIKFFVENDFFLNINTFDWWGEFWAVVYDLDMSNERLRTGILSILGGAKYVVPAGTPWGDLNGNFNGAPEQNFFVTNEAKITGQYFESSLNHGEIKALTSGDVVADFGNENVNPNKTLHIWDDDGFDVTGYWDID